METARLERRLLEWGLAGQVPNTREANLRAIRRLLDGDVFYTFGIERVREAAAAERLSESQVVGLMAAACGLPSHDAFLSDWGYIAPQASVEALTRASRLFRTVLDGRGRIAFGSGHPGAMVGYYNRLASYAMAHGATIVRGPVGELVGIDWYLDYVGSVAVTSDGCGILHGHSLRPMTLVLETAGPVDLVIADHGHAAAAINAGVPTIAVMDTNDPALAVALALGTPDLIVVPLYDNRMNALTEQLAEPFLELGAASNPPVMPLERDR